MKNFIQKNKNTIVNYILSMLFVFLIASVLIQIQGSNPLVAFTEMFRGAFSSKAAIASTIRWSIPVIITSQAALIAHRSGINNLGIEGQLYFGALASGLVGAFISLPHVPHVILAVLAGGLVGMIYAIIPALLKMFLKVDEMITTLMFNYTAILITEFITLRLMGLSSSTNPAMVATPQIQATASLSKILPPYQATSGIFIAIGLVVIIWFLYKHFVSGYEWKMLGNNFKFSKYGGIKVVKNFLTVFMLSGLVSGIAGALEIIGPHQRFRANFSTGLGWDGIMVALIAKNKPIPAFIVAVVWGAIKAGSLHMERMTSVNRILVTLVQALFVLFVTVDFRKIFKQLKNRNKRKELN